MMYPVKCKVSLTRVCQIAQEGNVFSLLPWIRVNSVFFSHKSADRDLTFGPLFLYFQAF